MILCNFPNVQYVFSLFFVCLCTIMYTHIACVSMYVDRVPIFMCTTLKKNIYRSPCFSEEHYCLNCFTLPSLVIYLRYNYEFLFTCTRKPQEADNHLSEHI